MNNTIVLWGWCWCRLDGYLTTNWKNKRKKTRATSSAQAEFLAMYEAVNDLLFQTVLLKEIGIHIVKVPLFCEKTC